MGTASTTPPGAGDIVVLDGFEVDFTQRRLRADGDIVHLAPKTWDFFEFVVMRVGRTVTKQEALAALWPDGRASEYAMTRTVRRLREALGDDARSPRYLRTVHGVGFEWIARHHIARPGAGFAPIDRTADFVGRVAEIERLAGAAASAARGLRQYLAVEGEMGAGKSLLVEHFLRHHTAGWWIASARCTDIQTGSEPYGPVIMAIDRLAQADPQRLDPLLRRFAPTWLAQMPWRVRPDDRDLVAAAVRVGSRGRMLRELGRFVDEVTIANPVIVFLDDVHWADAATLDAVSVLASRSERARLLVLTCHRNHDDAAVAAVVARLAAFDQARRVVVPPLNRVDLRALVDLRLPNRPEPDAIVDRLSEWTGGNALFAATAIDRWRVLDDADGDVSPVDLMSPDLRQMIDATIDRLDPDAVELMEAAALLGDEIDAALLGPVCGRPSIDTEQSIATIARRSPILHAASPEETSERFRFAHDAFRATLRRRVGPLRAERVHRRTADVLATGDPATLDHRRIAEHLRLGGRSDQAIVHWLHAARRSRRRFAYRDALDLSEHALAAIVARTDESGEASRRDHEIEARFGLALSQLAVRTGRHVETQRNIDRLTELVEPLKDDPDSFGVWQATLLANNLAGRTDRVRAMAPPLLSMAQHRGVPSELMDGHHAMGEAALHTGDLAASASAFERAARIHEEITAADADPSAGLMLWLRDSGARIQSALAGVAVLQGRDDDARRCVDTSVALATGGVNTPLARVGNLTICASISLLLGDDDRALDRADAAIDHAADEHPDFTAIADTIRWTVGEPFHLADVRRTARTLLDRPTVPFPLGLLVFLRADLLPPDEMLDVLDEAAELCEYVDTHWIDAEIAAQRARLLRLVGDGDEVAAALDEAAVAIATSQGARLFHR